MLISELPLYYYYDIKEKYLKERKYLSKRNHFPAAFVHFHKKSPVSLSYSRKTTSESVSLPLVSQRTEFNGCQVSLMWHKSFWVKLQTFQPNLFIKHSLLTSVSFLFVLTPYSNVISVSDVTLPIFFSTLLSSVSS